MVEVRGFGVSVTLPSSSEVSTRLKRRSRSLAHSRWTSGRRSANSASTKSDGLRKSSRYTHTADGAGPHQVRGACRADLSMSLHTIAYEAALLPSTLPVSVSTECGPRYPPGDSSVSVSAASSTNYTCTEALCLPVRSPTRHRGKAWVAASCPPRSETRCSSAAAGRRRAGGSGSSAPTPAGRLASCRPCGTCRVQGVETRQPWH